MRKVTDGKLLVWHLEKTYPEIGSIDMTVNKKQRFREVAEFDHVLEYTDYQKNENKKPAGQWQSGIFDNEHPITLELACGTGAYTIELARRFPDRNFVGIDIKGARIWKGAKKAIANKLHNVRFVRMYIDHLDEYFAENEVEEIWIPFADPFPRAGNRNKRLTNSRFLSVYEKVLKPDGHVHFKTDNSKFFSYTCRTVRKYGATIHRKITKLYEEQGIDDLLSIQTVYEERHRNNNKHISYCRFSF